MYRYMSMYTDCFILSTDYQTVVATLLTVQGELLHPDIMDTMLQLHITSFVNGHFITIKAIALSISIWQLI